MSISDLGKYYSDIITVKKEYKGEDSNNKEEDNYSPIKLYEAISKKTGNPVILKVINKDILKEEEDYDFHINHIEKEKEINYLCNSENVLRLNELNNNLQTDKYVVFEKEYCEKDLKEYIYNNGNLEKECVGKKNLQIFKDIAIDLAKALKYIHSKGVVHRNIKPHNIYLKETENNKYKAKLADFGSAIYLNEINDSEPMGTILYTAPEIIKNLDYNEKCDLWSVGLTLFEIYFGVLPYGSKPNIKKMNDMIYDEKKFIFGKSEIPTLDILFKRLLQINPNNRMSTQEFYDYVTHKDFLSPNVIAINNNKIYNELYKEISKQEQIDYEDESKKESNDPEVKEQQNFQKILNFVEEGNIPDIMSFPNASVNYEEKFNNIIYFDDHVEKHKTDIHEDADLFERETPGAFVLCSNTDSLAIIRDEILRHRKSEKKTIFNLISNGRGYVNHLKQFLSQNADFRGFINKLCIYCFEPDKYKQEKNELVTLITQSTQEVVNFIKQLSSKDIKPFPLTKLITKDEYLNKYKERHKKISEFYGDLTVESYKKNMEKIKEQLDNDEKDKLLKMKKEEVIKGLLTFNIEQDLENLDKFIIKEYTRNTYYGDLNRWLMKTKKMKYYEPVAYFTSRLMYSLNLYANKYNKYCENNKQVLHRGTKLYYSCLLPYERAVGKIILLSAFTSTSEGEDVAQAWAERGKGREKEVFKNSLKFSVIFHITNLYNSNTWISNAIDVQKNSEYKGEKEILFQPFSFYRVKKVTINIKDYTADIELETIGKKEILEEQIKIGKEIDYNENENIMQVKI